MNTGFESYSNINTIAVKFTLQKEMKELEESVDDFVIKSLSSTKIPEIEVKN